MSNANEQAYPAIETRPAYDDYRNLYAEAYSVGGLTKREYFAAMAMQGMCALEDNRYWTKTCGMTLEKWQADILARDAAHAVLTADALLAELAKEK